MERAIGKEMGSTYATKQQLWWSSAGWMRAMHPGAAGAAVCLTGLLVLLLNSPGDGSSKASLKKLPYPRWELRGTETMELWYAEHERQVTRSNENEASNLVFLGDSITQGWQHGAFSQRDPTLNGVDKPEEATLFNERFGGGGGGGTPPLNWAIGGDKVGDLAWRLTHGLETVRVSPDAFVLMIGTNDIKDPTRARAKDVAEGVMTSVVKRLETRWPSAKILLLGLLPRAPREFPITTTSEAWDENNAYFAPIHEINALLKAAAARDPRVTYLDCGAGLIEATDGAGGGGARIPRRTMNDYLHPSLEGYRVLADCIDPVLRRLIAAA